MSALYRAIVHGAAERYARQMRPCYVARVTIGADSNGILCSTKVPLDRVLAITLAFPDLPDRGDPEANAEVWGDDRIFITLGRIYAVPIVVEVTFWLKGDD